MTLAFEVETGVEAPPPRGQIRRAYAQLKVGGSILFRTTDIRRVRGYMHRVQREHRVADPSFRLVARACDEGVRVWRIQ